MRLSELLNLPVRDAEGTRLGTVADVVLRQDGKLDGVSSSYQVVGLVVVEKDHTRLLGYERDVRPALFRWYVVKRAGAIYRVRWSDIDSVDSSCVRLRAAKRDLSPHSRSKSPSRA